jgi:hypothetical protein
MKIRTILCLVFFVSCIANAAIVSNPIVPPLADLGECDENYDGIEIFNLSVQTPIILAAQSTQASDYNVSYHLTQFDANTGSNSLDENTYINMSSQQTIYVRVRNITTSEFSVGSFQINAYSPAIPTFGQIQAVCLGSIPPVLPTVSTNGIYGTWSPSTIDTSVLGTYIMTFTPDYGQCASTVTMAVTVAPSSTLNLVSSVATTNQTVCVNSAISNIVYVFGGNATGATVTGLPVGLTASISGSIVTIYGAVATISGFYPYTVTATGGCYQAMNGSITVSNNAVLTLISSPATTNQTLCYNQPITNIVYQLSGGATGASVTGLPAGVTSSVIGSTLIISGTSTTSGQYNFTVTTIGGCGIQSLTGTITVLPYPRINTNYVLEDVLCVDYNSNTVINPMLLQVSSGYYGPNMNHTYQWYLNGVAIVGATNTTYLVDTPDLSGATRNYSVEFTDVTAMGCQGMSSDFQVIQSGPASPIGIGYSIVNNAGNQTITVEVEGYGTYKYALDGLGSQFSPVFSNVPLGLHTITISDTEGNSLNNCSPIVISNVDVNLTTTPPPTGNTSQSFGSGATLADIQVSGQNIQWYSGANKSVAAGALPINTLLVNGTTYYASQKIGGYESTSRLPVTAQVSLSNTQFELKGLTYAPNPVATNLSIKCNEMIDEVKVYNLLGQLVNETKALNSELQLDLSSLKSGNYFVKVSSGSSSSTFKIIKE